MSELDVRSFAQRIQQLDDENTALRAQLAEAHKDCDDLRALAERLLAKLSEGKVMIDDIRITPEETV